MSKGKTRRAPASCETFLKKLSGHAAARAAAAGHARHPARQARRARRVRQAVQGRAQLLRRHGAARRQGPDFREHRQWRPRRRSGCDLHRRAGLARARALGAGADGAGAAVDGDRERRAVLRRSAPGAAECHEAACRRWASPPSLRPSSSSICSKRMAIARRAKVGRIPGTRRVAGRTAVRHSWRISRMSIPSSPSCIRCARRRTCRSARR